jgi:DNA helicase-2/ATP-dependent DNA helicase PcrA
VLTYRISHLINHGIDPFAILALTFTNKAAAEMRQRIEKVVGPEARSIWMGTFHSIFARILRIEAHRIGYTRDFSIYDTDDSKSLIRTILKELNLDDKVYRVGTVLHRISMAKNSLISVNEYLRNEIFKAEDEGNRVPDMGRLYRAYQDRLLKANAMDFDDLLFNTNVLFRDHIDVLNKYQQKFRYVMVDEFQDTNVSQYVITRKLAAVHQNICVVGDDAQSIYAFRGANIQNILNFEKDYPELKIIKLEQNYRSTKTIVQAANSVINKNKAQLRKAVWTDNEDGSLIDLVKAGSDNEEGVLIANSIFEEKCSIRSATATLPFSTAPTPSRGPLKKRCAARTSSTASWAASRSTSARRSRTWWPTCVSPPTRTTKKPSSASSTCPSAASAKAPLPRSSWPPARRAWACGTW